jgi:hypothetical protein
MADISYDLACDLATERCFLDPTPGAANDESQTCGFVEPVAFDVPHGFHDAPFDVALSTITPGATIRYTTDGSEPTESEGTVYAAPIGVTTTTAISAVAYKAGLSMSPSTTQTYIFLDDVVHQSQSTIPPAFPSVWAAGVAADYDMDPDVVDDPLYSPTIRDDLKSIPTLSVVTAVEHLFDPQTGIYTHTLRTATTGRPPGRADPSSGGAGFQKNSGIRIRGDVATPPTKALLSLRFRRSMRETSSTALSGLTCRLPSASGAAQNTWHSNLAASRAGAVHP